MSESTEDPVRVEVERVLVSQQEAVVVLAPVNGFESGRVLPVFVDLGQAMNIQVSLEGKMVGRPLTHDLFTTVLNQMNAIVDRVVIEEIAQNTFFANLQIEFEKNGKRDRTVFDARPSDCIALAVRAGAPIFVRRAVLESASVERERLMADAQEVDDEESGLGGQLFQEPPDDDDHDEAPPRRPPPRIDPEDLERP